MSCQEIADQAGLSKSYVAHLSAKRSWAGVPIDVVQAFSLACGVDIMRPKPVISFLKRKKKVYLDRATTGQRKFFSKIMKAA